MALARRLGGRAAAVAAGLYLALGPRFLTVFSLNCVGQYVDVLALGGLALALLARAARPRTARGRAARASTTSRVGLLLGAAFWQQPVALGYAWRRGGSRCCCAAAPGAIRWTLARAAGLAWWARCPCCSGTLQNGWASGDILGREPAELRAQADALSPPCARTLQRLLPDPGRPQPRPPLGRLRGRARAVAAVVVPAALVAYLALRGRGSGARCARAAGPAPAPAAARGGCLALFWAVASGRVYWRPRYLLPVVAATAVHLGVALAALWLAPPVGRGRCGGLLLGVLALNVAGFAAPHSARPRIAAAYYQGLVRSLDEKGIRTGYADFSISAPVTMFTAERILLSPRLGPTPAYTSARQESRGAPPGRPAYVLRPRDDADAFAAVLKSLGVSYRLDREPVPAFHHLSRPVTIEEVLAAWGRAGDAEATPE